MRLRNIRGASETIAASQYVISDPENYKGKWSALFGNSNPIHVELGMGKGKFITTLAKMNPDINYIGVELYDSVLLRAVQKLEADEEYDGKNLYFLSVNASNIENYFAPEEISRIYLNFSDPWPKDRHAKRRLTSKQFIAHYDKVLAHSGEICFKTDNTALFDFSLEEIVSAGWTLRDVTRDLHHSIYAAGNVMTEYEEKFSSMGNPIYRLVAYR